jgi:1-piperideine-2-carboxylate/1-pyrroline-2-carboxylate reductase [NAD(P)H]
METLGPPAEATVLVIGTGNQARHHVLALAALRPRWYLRVRGRSLERAQQFCAALDVEVRPTRDDEADVVITCTSSAVPVYDAPTKVPRLVVAMGSFRPTIAEVEATTVRASALFVDDLDGALHEAGDLLCAGVDWDRVGTLAQLARGEVALPTRALFKSVGCAAWDLAAARVALRAG